MIDPMVGPGRLEKRTCHPVGKLDYTHSLSQGILGAELAALVREAGVLALKRILGTLNDMDDNNAEMSKVQSG